MDDKLRQIQDIQRRYAHRSDGEAHLIMTLLHDWTQAEIELQRLFSLTSLGLERILARRKAITPGAWWVDTWTHPTTHEKRLHVRSSSTDEYGICEILGQADGEHAERIKADANFISCAPVDIDTLINMVIDQRLELEARASILDHNVAVWKEMFPDEDGNSWYYPGDKVKACVSDLKSRAQVAEERYALLADKLGDEIGILRRRHERYLAALPDIRRVALVHGYATAVHGSELRDFDLVLFPWVDEVAAPETVIAAIVQEIHGVISEDKTYPVQKPHHRLAWSVQIGAGAYFDISVVEV